MQNDLLKRIEIVGGYYELDEEIIIRSKEPVFDSLTGKTTEFRLTCCSICHGWFQNGEIVDTSKVKWLPNGSKYLCERCLLKETYK